MNSRQENFTKLIIPMLFGAHSVVADCDWRRLFSCKCAVFLCLSHDSFYWQGKMIHKPLKQKNLIVGLWYQRTFSDWSSATCIANFISTSIVRPPCRNKDKPLSCTIPAVRRNNCFNILNQVCFSSKLDDFLVTRQEKRVCLNWIGEISDMTHGRALMTLIITSLERLKS